MAKAKPLTLRGLALGSAAWSAINAVFGPIAEIKSPPTIVAPATPKPSSEDRQ